MGEERPRALSASTMCEAFQITVGERPDEPALRLKIQAEVARAVAAANERMSRIEQIKRFKVIAGEWAPGGEELTPTMKLRRRPIERPYEAEIVSLYAG